MNQYAIVVIAYNRTKSLNRLLDSLNQAAYGGDQVPLIISVDYSENNAVRELAEAYLWKHGEKKIRFFQERQGLRQHVLKCGDYLREYDAIAVFEDDIYAAPGFYRFMKEAVPYYEQDERVAGISLYSHRWNPLTDRAFEPLRTESDVFFMQIAQSWGQIWMKKQWYAFRNWYDDLGEKGRKAILEMEQIPQVVRLWPESSWLKYHMAYGILHGRYFVYPYESLTTNCADAGENFRKETWRYQVSMQTGEKQGYRLQPLEPEAVRYDGFYESQMAANSLGIREEEICVDLYGSKPGNMGKKYWLTNRVIPGVRKKKSFGLLFRPLEANILNETPGDDFILYETDRDIRVTVSQKLRMRDMDYDSRREGLALKNLMRWAWYKIWHS